MSYSDLAPDTATFSFELGLVEVPVLIENPLTLGLYFLIISNITK